MRRTFAIDELRVQTSWGWRIGLDFFLVGTGTALFLISGAFLVRYCLIKAGVYAPLI